MHSGFIAFVAIAPFVSTTITDPVYGGKTSVFAASDEGNTLLLSCTEKSNSLEIHFAPARYYLRSPLLRPLLWSPRADSRFSKAEEPMRDTWLFEEKGITFDDVSFGGNERKARFLDQMARDTSFSIRYEASPGEVTTSTITYSIDPEELGRFLAKCDPKRVNRYLREWGSPAAPPTPSD